LYSLFNRLSIHRWGDAPVHSIAVALMLKRSDVHWFYDIGYKHDFFEHCPTEEKWFLQSKCYCDPETTFGEYLVI
jgi:alpha 1,2-mannosyltransferase